MSNLMFVNRSRLTLVVIVFWALCAVWTTALAAGDAAAGQAKSATCVACHGADGNSNMNPQWPKLAGQHPGYTIKQLQNFKNGERNNAQMAPMAANLSDQDMADLAAYYASQTLQPGYTNADLAAVGEAIYRGGDLSRNVPACTGCHGPAGNGNSAAKFPSLAGQHAAYTVLQLNTFRAGERGNDLNGMMQAVAANMTDEQIEAVASYIQGLR